MKNRLHVALNIGTADAYGRQLLQGISRYACAHDNWSVFFRERALWTPPPEWLQSINDVDGLICRAMTPDFAEAILHNGLPTVDLNARHGYLGVPRVASDMEATGRMAARHLQERGFRFLAFCGFSDLLWSTERQRGVEQAAPGQFCGAFNSLSEDLWERPWEVERDEIGKWLQTMPRPLGLVACNDERGYHVLEACRLLNIGVPEEIAVVGVDNSETFCKLCVPPLSSVLPNAEAIGYEAAALLDRLMQGETVSETNRLIPPSDVITRQSSDTVSIEDPDVALAVRFIRENACKGITVSDVLDKTTLSRSALDRNFQRLLGHSPHDEIQRIRLNRVKQLLVETDWALERIADMTGFGHAEYMMVLFKRVTGKTPTHWRQEAQIAASLPF
jgi:LacI family transcriptional regulator